MYTMCNEITEHNVTYVLFMSIMGPRPVLLCPVLPCRYPGPVCCVGGWDELLRHEDRPQQRHLSPLPATQQPTGHRNRQVHFKKFQYTQTHTNHSTQSHSRKHTRSSHWVMVYIHKQKQTRPICSRLIYFANTAMSENSVTAVHKEWKQNNCV